MSKFLLNGSGSRFPGREQIWIRISRIRGSFTLYRPLRIDPKVYIASLCHILGVDVWRLKIMQQKHVIAGK